MMIRHVLKDVLKILAKKQNTNYRCYKAKQSI